MFDWLIHSKTRLRMLKLFFRDVTRPLYGLEISQKLNASPGTTHRELNAMLSRKILVKKREGALVLYQLNTKHPHFLELQSVVKPPSKSDTILFISDLHLDHHLDPIRFRQLEAMFNYAEKNASELVLLGDTFETLEGDFLQTWLLYKPLLDQLVRLATQIKVTCVLGNHDVLLRSFLNESGEGTLFSTKIRLQSTYENKKRSIYAEHGDRFDNLSNINGKDPDQKDSRGKQLLKELNGHRSEAYPEYYDRLRQFALSAHERRDYGYTLKGNTTRKQQVLKKQIKAAEALLKEKSVKTVIMGHAHIHMVQKLKGGHFVNTGSWKHPDEEKFFVEVGKKGVLLRSLKDIEIE